MRRFLLFGLLCVLVVAGPGLAAAAVPEAERIPMIDPDELLDAGHEPDAENVYRWVHAPEGEIDGNAPDEYGDNNDFKSITAMAFLDLKEGFVRDWTNGHELFCPSGDYPYVIAQLHLPDGARLDGIRYWIYDNDGTDDAYVYLAESCLPDLAAGNPSTLYLISNAKMGSGTTPTSYSAFIQVSPQHTIDNPSCDYLIKVRLASSVSGTCQGSMLRLQKIRAQFARQVTPAPATATFNDVPTGHWAFRHIEALAASGITSGCGGGSFCPDTKLSRAEMAIFLSKALGLYWDLSNH